MVVETLECFIERIKDDPPGVQFQKETDFWQVMGFQQEQEDFLYRISERLNLPEHDNWLHNALELVDWMMDRGMKFVELSNGGMEKCVNDNILVNYLGYAHISVDKDFVAKLPLKSDAIYGLTKQTDEILNTGLFLFSELFGGVFTALSKAEYFAATKDELFYHTQSSKDSSDNIYDRIEYYQKIMIPSFKSSIAMAYSIYFDLRNIILDDFIDDEIKSFVEISTIPKHIVINNTSEISMFGLSTLLYSNCNCEQFIVHKKRFVKGKIDDLHQKFCMYPALMIYCHNISNTFRIPDVPVNLIVGSFKQQEFWDYIKHGDFQGYIEAIRDKKDFGTNAIPAIQRINAEVNEEYKVGNDFILTPEFQEIDKAVTAYLSLFTGEENNRRKPENLGKYCTDEFVTLWINAFNNGWGDAVYDNIYTLDEVVEYPENAGFLAVQDSPWVVILLKNELFRNYFINESKAKHLNYSLLGNLMEIDPKLFEIVFPHTTKDDDKFLESILGLAINFGEECRGIFLNADSKQLISNVGDCENEDLRDIVFLLNNYEDAQAAIDYGLAPTSYTGKIPNQDDIISYANWFKENSKEVQNKTSLIPKVRKYVGQSKNKALRRNLLEIAKKQNSDFVHKYLPGFASLAAYYPVRYQRVIDLLAHAGNPKNICRHRELKNALEYMATVAEPEWDVFREGLVKASSNGKTYKDVFEDNNAFRNAKAHARARKHNGNGLINSVVEEAYSRAFENGNEEICNRLDNLRSLKVISSDRFQMVCGIIASSQFKLAERYISEFEAGGFGKVNAELMNSFGYTTDEDLEMLDPKELPDYKQHEQDDQKQTQIQKKPEFDYSAFNETVRHVGFKPEHVRKIVEYGFKLVSGERIIGENYTCYGRVRDASIGGSFAEMGLFQCQYPNIISWLHKIGVIKHKYGKGKSLTDASSCISLEPHLDKIDLGVVKDYMKHQYLVSRTNRQHP